MILEVIIMAGAIFCGLFVIALTVGMKSKPGLLKNMSSSKSPAAPAQKPECSEDDESEEMQACRKLASMEPENPEHWVRWGNMLVDATFSIKSSDLYIHRLNEACTCYQRAVELAPAHMYAWRNWGQALFLLFRHQQCANEELLELANSKYEIALGISPDNAIIWQLWGEELRTCSYDATGEMKRFLQEESASRFAKGLELNQSASFGAGESA